MKWMAGTWVWWNVRCRRAHYSPLSCSVKASSGLENVQKISMHMFCELSRRLCAIKCSKTVKRPHSNIPSGITQITEANGEVEFAPATEKKTAKRVRFDGAQSALAAIQPATSSNKFRQKTTNSRPHSFDPLEVWVAANPDNPSQILTNPDNTQNTEFFLLNEWWPKLPKRNVMVLRRPIRI